MNKKAAIIVSAVSLVLAAAMGVSAFLSFQNYKALSAQMEGASTQMTSVMSQIDGMREEVRTRVDLVQANVDSLRENLEKKDEPEETREDDVTIASEYVIRSTTQISDAYKSGDSASLSDKDKETLDMASAVLKQIITDKMSDYDKELAVYDWMTANLENDPGLLPVVPTTQEDCDNPYGVLKYHNAVCVGYATTFRLFMQMLDIPCMVVHNTELFHSWDLVQLNGHWYHTDIYSDAGKPSHSHFNRTDIMQQMDQTWDTSFFPKSDSTEDCYAAKNAVEEKDVYKIPAEVRRMLDEKINYLAFRIPREADNHSALVLETLLNRIQDTVAYNTGSDCGTVDMSWQWLQLDKNYVVSIVVNSSNTEDDQPDLPEEDLNRIEHVMEEIFGDYMFCE